MRQALADRLPADQLPDAVRRLVGNLASPSAKARDRATRELAGLGEGGMVVLKDFDRTGLAPQQVMAIDTLLERFKPLAAAEADRLRNDVDFLFDCLYSDEPDVASAALATRKLNRGEDVHPNLSAPPDRAGRKSNRSRPPRTPHHPARGRSGEITPHRCRSVLLFPVQQRQWSVIPTGVRPRDLGAGSLRGSFCGAGFRLPCPHRGPKPASQFRPHLGASPLPEIPPSEARSG